MGCAGLDREDLVDAYLSGHPELSRQTAGCVVDTLVETHGVDGLESELAADPESSEFQLAHLRARFGCGITSDVVDELGPQLIERGLDAETASCVVDALTRDMEPEDLDVVLSGTMTDDFYSRYFDAMEECDAV